MSSGELGGGFLLSSPGKGVGEGVADQQAGRVSCELGISTPAAAILK
jgi:hypothetical protein